MPHKPVRGSHNSTGPRCVLERTECAALIGAIVAEWSATEAMLAYHYGVLATAREDPLTLVSMGAFEFIISLPQKRKILLYALKKRGFTGKVFDTYAELFERVQKSGKTRIVSAHGRWGINDASPNGLAWSRSIADPHDCMIYEPKDLKEDMEKIIEARTDLHKFFQSTVLPTLSA